MQRANMSTEYDQNQTIATDLYEAAVALVEQRYPRGWGGAIIIGKDRDQYCAGYEK